MKKLSIKKLLIIFTVIALSSCGNPVKQVQKGRLSLDQSITLERAVKGYKGLKNVKWEKFKDEQGRLFVTMSGSVDAEVFFEVEGTNLSERDHSSYMNKDIREYVHGTFSSTTITDISDDFQNHYANLSEYISDADLVTFNYKKTKVKVYIQFQIINKKEFAVVSSAYEVELKSKSPNIGGMNYFHQNRNDGTGYLEMIYGQYTITSSII